MRNLALVIALLGAPPFAAAQDTVPTESPIIEAAEVSGLALDQLSQELRQDIGALAGTRLSRERLAALASRIETEHPDVVAAVRDVARPDGRVRVVFLIARISEDTTLATNINARYTVERVEVSGIDESKISSALRDELQRLVGHRFDSDQADVLADRLEAEHPDYEVGRRLSRGEDSGGLRVVFTFTQPEYRRWLRFRPSRSKLVYHEDQGWSGVLDLQFGGARNNQFSLGFVGGNADDLVEEYSGYWFQFANRQAFSRRLGVSLEFARFTETWRPATLSALELDPGLPRAYDTRLTVEPTVRFALTRRLSFTTGVSVSELEPLPDALGSQRANAGLASFSYDQSWRPEYPPETHRRTRVRHRVEASYTLRAGTTDLDSDFVYQRHAGRAQYEFELGPNTLIARLMLGHISGDAPLFERFTLGDSATLRGWDKYKIAPAGADRMWHQSIEYRYRNFAYFFDAGSVWTRDVERELRLSTGVGFHGDSFFLTFGVPLNADDVDWKFMAGVRLGGRF